MLRYLSRFKKIVKDRSLFEDNQVSSELLQASLASAALDEPDETDVEDEREGGHLRDTKVHEDVQ